MLDEVSDKDALQRKQLVEIEIVTRAVSVITEPRSRSRKRADAVNSRGNSQMQQLNKAP
jgi:hypothetical protein